MRSILALLGLSISFTAGCVQSGTDNNSVRTKDEAMAEARSRSAGPSTSVCDIPYDSDGDGVNDDSLIAIGEDGDDDGLAVIPTDWDDIFADGQYACATGVVNGTVQVTDDSIGLDCLDDNPEVGDAEFEVYLDTDGDGFGDSADTASMACGVDEGYSSDNTDCDDSDWDINPDADEVCDNVDNDCSGLVDDGLENFWFAPDVDGDTFGDPEGQLYACSAPAEWYVLDATDCNDSEESGYYVNPDATEVCDTIDNNCDELIDDVYLGDILFDSFDAMSAGAVASYSDADGDAYAGTWYGYVCSSEMEGLSSEPSDCDDGNSSVNPGMSETTGNGVDDDCDAATSDVAADPDADMDGYAASVDCDDGNSSVNPGMSETTGNGVDDDCDAATSDVAADPDADMDTYAASVDCDDGNSSVYPGATEVAGNGIDDDCNGGVEVSGDGIDNDNDGVVQGEDVCVDPISGVDTLSAELYASNYTDDPNVLVTTGVVGTGTLCWATDLTVGEQWKVNAPVSGGSFWWVMLDADNIDAVTLGGLAPSAETYHSWGSGRDLVVTVPTFPTE